MKSFAQKKAELAKLKDRLAKSRMTVFTTFSRVGEKGLGVKAMGELKRALRGVEAEYMVSKKTLADRALGAQFKYLNIETAPYNGSLGLTFIYGDAASAAKTLYGFTRKHPALKLFSALWGDRVLDEQSFLEFAKLPSREILIGRVLGLMKYPLSALANVLGQVAEKK